MTKSLNVFTFPDFNQAGTITYRNFSWKHEDYIVFTTIGLEKPDSPVDLSNYQYVAMYDLQKERIIPVKMYDPLSEYSLIEETENYLILERTYVERLSDWADLSLWKTEEILMHHPLGAEIK